jgi:hypothetical protein
VIAAAVKVGASLLTSLAAIAGCQGAPQDAGTCQVGYSNQNGFCVPDRDYEPPVVPAVNPVIVVWEDGPVGDVDPPTRLDMWMNDEGSPRERCQNYGGTPRPVQGLILCEGIDY